MAKITIELDTHDRDKLDDAILAALYPYEANSLDEIEREERAERVFDAGIATITERIEDDTPHLHHGLTDADLPEDRPIMINGDTFREAGPSLHSTQPEQPKRTRRTKAQIEADNAAAAGGGTSSSASEPASAAETPSTSGPDPLDGEKEATLDMLNDRIRFLMGNEVSAKTLVDLCKKISGAASAKQADPKFYPAIWAALEDLMPQ